MAYAATVDKLVRAYGYPEAALRALEFDYGFMARGLVRSKGASGGAVVAKCAGQSRRSAVQYSARRPPPPAAAQSRQTSAPSRNCV